MPTKKRIHKVRQQNPAAESASAPSLTLTGGTGAFLLFRKEIWDNAGGQHHPGISSWWLWGFGMLKGIGNFGSFHPGLARL